MSTRRDSETYLDPDGWFARTPVRQGSWWSAWQQWLVQRSSGTMPPPGVGSEPFPVLCDAPGTYVMQE